jgi:hypothetical protein
MYNDLQVPAQEINPVAINHTDYAFLAAKNGESEFLEVLLGPSIPAEKHKREELLVLAQGVFEVTTLWEFRCRLAESKLAVLQNFEASPVNFAELNQALHASAVQAIDVSLALFDERQGLHKTAYYSVDQLQFPTLDLNDRRLGRSALTMKDFFNAQDGIKHDEKNIYCVELTDDMKASLKRLQGARYKKQAEAVGFELIDKPDVALYIAQLNDDVAIATSKVEALLAERTVINNQCAELDDLQYNQRKQRFDGLVEKFKRDLSKVPSVYRRVPLPELPALLKSAKVPVSVRDKEGNTLLHVASEARQYHVVRLLLERDADLNALNQMQATPWDLARLTGPGELKALAKVYKKRSESKFLADVVKAVGSYKEEHEKILNSFKKYLHTDKRLAERADQLLAIQAGIERAKQVPTDDLLVLTILTINLLATRGSRGRSTLLDPLMGHVSRYLKEKGYGVTNQDIMEIFNGEHVGAVNDELARANSELMADKKLLEGLLRERDSTIAQKIKDIQALATRNELNEKKISSLLEEKESYEAMSQDRMEMEAEINALRQSMDKLLLLVSQMSGAALVEPTARLTNTPGTLFIEAPSSGSGKYGAILMDSLGKDGPTPSRPN